MLSDADCGAHETHASGCIFSEVDWGLIMQVFPLPRSAFTMMEGHMTVGRTTTKDIFDLSHGVAGRCFGYWTN